MKSPSRTVTVFAVPAWAVGANVVKTAAVVAAAPMIMSFIVLLG
jgi:hypothetical protein